MKYFTHTYSSGEIIYRLDHDSFLHFIVIGSVREINSLYWSSNYGRFNVQEGMRGITPCLGSIKKEIKKFEKQVLKALKLKRLKRNAIKI